MRFSRAGLACMMHTCMHTACTWLSSEGSIKTFHTCRRKVWYMPKAPGCTGAVYTAAACHKAETTHTHTHTHTHTRGYKKRSRPLHSAACGDEWQACASQNLFPYGRAVTAHWQYASQQESWKDARNLAAQERCTHPRASSICMCRSHQICHQTVTFATVPTAVK